MGNTILYVDGCDFYITTETKGFDKRGVEPPITEGVVKGPQEGFNENLRTNTTLVRRIIKNSALTTEFIKVGSVCQNLCAIMYLNDIANPAIVEEVKRRLNGIKTDSLFSSGMLEQFLDSNTWSFIPTVLSTERPDRAASHITEGKVQYSWTVRLLPLSCR
jgi:spore germination protein KA